MRRRLGLLLVLAAAAEAIAAAGAEPARAHGPFHQQIAAANERVAGQPGNPDALIARGELYRQHGDYDAALADFGEAARLMPASDAADLLRGRTLVDAGRAYQALIYLDRYVARHPDGAAAFLERARAHQAVVAPVAAADDYQRALDLTPKPSPDDYLRRMRAQLAAGREEAALGGLDEGIARLGPLVSLELPAIDLELAARRWDDALRRLERVAAQSPRQESFLQRRGEILLQAGRRGEARRTLRAALAAIAALPPHLRNTAATAELETKVRRQLRPASGAARQPAGGSSRSDGR